MRHALFCRSRKIAAGYQTVLRRELMVLKPHRICDYRNYAKTDSVCAFVGTGIEYAFAKTAVRTAGR